MAGTVQATPDDLLTCEKCHGFYAVEVPEDGTEPRVRCNACGHIREVPIAPVQQKSDDGNEGKWTVIGPDGTVMSYPSWEKLVRSQHPSVMTEIAKVVGAGSASKIAAASPEEKKPSASALLDVTPTPALPKLALAELDSDPNLLAATAKPSPEELARSFARSKAPETTEKTKGPEWAPVKSKAPPPPAPGKEMPPESIREIDSASIIETSSEDEPAPLSLRDAIVEDDEPAPLSLRDAIVEDDDKPEEAPHETLSLKDLQVVPAPDSAVDSTPPPPARGVLRTLPPIGSKDRGTAPPPTITVEDPPASKKPASKTTAKDDKPTKAEGKTTRSDVKKAESKETDKDEPKRSSASKTTGATAAKDDRKPVASAKAAVSEDEPKRGWLLPSLAVAAIVVVIWRMMAASPATTETTPPAPAATAVATTAAPAASTGPTESAPTSDPAAATADPPSAPAETSTAPTPATPTTTATATATKPVAGATTEKKPAAAAAATEPATEKKPATASESGMSMSDLLDRAGSARRSGDYATARDLYERVLKMNPGNVEANGGLGDVARAQGDLNSAKASYERALAASPAYGPAQLGLADTEWDLGNRAGAQRRYAQIVERLGDRAPERAKQRGVVTE